MIAQWKDECISPSVHPVAQVMIAQWENECISLSAYLPRGPGHDTGQDTCSAPANP